MQPPAAPLSCTPSKTSRSPEISSQYRVSENPAQTVYSAILTYALLLNQSTLVGCAQLITTTTACCHLVNVTTLYDYYGGRVRFTYGFKYSFT